MITVLYAKVNGTSLPVGKVSTTREYTRMEAWKLRHKLYAKYPESNYFTQRQYQNEIPNNNVRTVVM